MSLPHSLCVPSNLYQHQSHKYQHLMFLTHTDAKSKAIPTKPLMFPDHPQPLKERKQRSLRHIPSIGPLPSSSKRPLNRSQLPESQDLNYPRSQNSQNSQSKNSNEDRMFTRELISLSCSPRECLGSCFGHLRAGFDGSLEPVEDGLGQRCGPTGCADGLVETFFDGLVRVGG